MKEILTRSHGRLRNAKLKTIGLLAVLLLAVCLICGCGAGGSTADNAGDDQVSQVTKQQDENADDADAAAESEEAAETDADNSAADKDAGRDTDRDADGSEDGYNDPDPEDHHWKDDSGEKAIDRDGSYDSKDEVALYLYTYGYLPPNYITKKEAKKLGWRGGGLDRYAPGKCIGGDHFGNYERRLPDDDYHECDIGTMGKRDRGARRLIYSDEAIYYTDDHYKTFEQLYDANGKL